MFSVTLLLFFIPFGRLSRDSTLITRPFLEQNIFNSLEDKDINQITIFSGFAYEMLLKFYDSYENFNLELRDDCNERLKDLNEVLGETYLNYSIKYSFSVLSGHEIKPFTFRSYHRYLNSLLKNNKRRKYTNPSRWLYYKHDLIETKDELISLKQSPREYTFCSYFKITLYDQFKPVEYKYFKDGKLSKEEFLNYQGRVKIIKSTSSDADVTLIFLPIAPQPERKTLTRYLIYILPSEKSEDLLPLSKKVLRILNIRFEDLFKEASYTWVDLSIPGISDLEVTTRLKFDQQSENVGINIMTSLSIESTNSIIVPFTTFIGYISFIKKEMFRVEDPYIAVVYDIEKKAILYTILDPRK